MVKIVHLSDTHLGYRVVKGTINKWAIPNYSRPYEQEIYDAFLKVIEDISKIEDLDFLVHCGDMFHVPSIDISYPPPEPARIVLEKALNVFFKNTDNRVPFVYIEGNHGVFKGYDYTPFETHIGQNKYPNLYYYKERDLLNAIANNSPLSLEFKSKKVRFYLFPYFEFKSHRTYKEAYNKWVENQRPRENDEFVNVAVAHGSKLDKTLHNKVKEFNYDYVALGHEHGFKQESNNGYYTGCLLPMNFKERYENQGYLIVNIDEKTKELKIEKISTDKMLKRTFELVHVDVSPQDTEEDFKNSVNKEINKLISAEGFNPNTAARLKMLFQGEMTFEKIWQIDDIMSKMRRDCFSQPEKYNILQLIWKISDTSELIENDIGPGFIEDYILESPDAEFKAFVEEKLREDKTKYNVDKLTHFGVTAIKNALNIMDKEKED